MLLFVRINNDRQYAKGPSCHIYFDRSAALAEIIVDQGVERDLKQGRELLNRSEPGLGTMLLVGTDQRSLDPDFEGEIVLRETPLLPEVLYVGV